MSCSRQVASRLCTMPMCLVPNSIRHRGPALGPHGQAGPVEIQELNLGGAPVDEREQITDNGSYSMTCLASAYRPSKDRRMLTGWPYRNTLTWPSGKTSAPHDRQHEAEIDANLDAGQGQRRWCHYMFRGLACDGAADGAPRKILAHRRAVCCATNRSSQPKSPRPCRRRRCSCRSRHFVPGDCARLRLSRSEIPACPCPAPCC